LSLRALRALVVDDDPVNRLVATAELAALGYTAEATDNGETALDLLAREPYDAVLLDCEMPRLDGYETCRRLRQRETGGRRTWVIALTAHSAPGEREKCLAAGMDDHLRKPWRGEELAAVLRRWQEDPGSSLPAAESDGIEERLAALGRLGARTGEDVLGQVLESFFHQGARDLGILRRALARGDGAAFAAAAHSLAGSSGILGAAGLAVGCAELEKLVRQGDLAACESRLPAVEQAWQAVARKLRQDPPGASANAALRSAYNKC
jgi:CheY-like chemotaxis protein/HPt (histidine-containing phosphotransfer) domain-containing protein